MPQDRGRSATRGHRPSKGKPTLREQQRWQTRRLFIEAAAASFRANGYAATSVDDIAKAAGATRATFYLHFSGKADVMHELLATVGGETVDIHERLTEAVAAGTREAIAAWLDSAFDFWERLGSLLRAQEEAAALHPEVSQARDDVFEGGVAAVVAGMERAGRGGEATRRPRGVLAYAQLQSMNRRWMRRGWDIDRATTLEVMTDVWMTIFAAPPAVKPGSARRTARPSTGRSAPSARR